MDALGTLGINLENYAHSADGSFDMGNANTTQEALSQLSKALEAGELTGRDTTNLTNASGAPLKVESLDKTLKLLTFRESEIVVWKKIPKDQAYNTVEEYNQQTTYGSSTGGFILEGELPQDDDSAFVRRAQLVKFMGVVKSVTHVLTLTNTVVANLIDKASKDGTMWILGRLNRNLVYADSNCVPEEFNGLYAQHARHDNLNYQGGSLAAYLGGMLVIDKRGGVLTEADMELANEAIVENHGIGTDLFAPPKVLSGFVKAFYGEKFIQPNTAAVNEGVMGQRVVAHMTNYGRLNLNYDIFMNKPAPATVGQQSAQSTNQKAPASPVAGGSPVTLVSSDALSLFETPDIGVDAYAVRSRNRFGQSALVTLGTVSIAAALNAVDLSFSAGSGGEPATCFDVYRSTTGGGTTQYYYLFTVSAAELATGYNGAAAGYARDRNFYLPNVDQAFMIQNEAEVWEYKQLCPLMKMDLAIISPAYRFMVLQYGTPLMGAPTKMVRFINVRNITSPAPNPFITT